MQRLISAAVLACATVAMAAPCAAQAADTCPNAQYRKGDGAKLPDCRAWEQATPVDKGGSRPVDALGALTTPSGDRVLTLSPGDIGNSQGGSFNGTFSSVRGSGWSTFGVDAPIDARPVPFFDAVGRTTIGFSDDRSKAIVVSLQKLTPEAVAGDSNLYVRDTADGSYSFAARSAGSTLYSVVAGTEQTRFLGASPDFKHIVIASTAAILPGALDDGGSPNLYLISGGQITLVSQSASGEAFSAGVPSYPSSGPQPVSNDGRRVTFVGQIPFPFNIGLYQRVNGTSTVAVSKSQRTGDEQERPVDTTGTVWPSADGTEVTFAVSTQRQLTNDGPPSPLYRWRAQGGGGTLTNLLTGVTPPWSATASSFALLHTSPDGRYLWVVYADTDQNGDPTDNLALLDTQARRADIKATAPPRGLGQQGPFFDELTSRFSPDGTRMLGLTNQPVTQYDNVAPDNRCRSASGFPTNLCTEAFAFDATQPNADPVCISCGPAGTRSLGDAGAGGALLGGPLPTAVLNDGKMFFDTPQPLVASDANVLADVYEYTPGRPPELISSGTGGSPARMGSVSQSGNDVFFFTVDSLVAQDDDGTADVYDARVNGGLAAQQVARATGGPCPSGSCPGSLTQAPAAQTPGSALVRGVPRPPGFSVSRVSAAARRTAASTGRLRVSVRVGGAGRLSARASARLGRRTSLIGRASSAPRKAGRVTLTLKLSSAARRALARDRKLAVALSVSYSRASKAAKQSFTLRSSRSTKGGAR